MNTKKHLKDLGLAFKVAFVLPDGAVIGGEDDGEAGAPMSEGTETEEQVPAPASNGKNEDAARVAALKQQIKDMSPKVAALAKSGHPAAGKLATALKTAVAALGSGQLDKAEAVLAKVAPALDKIGDAAPQTVDDAAPDNSAKIRKQLETAFRPIAQDLDKLKDEAGEKVAQKADQVATMFWQVLDASDWKKAVSVLKLSKAFADKEIAALTKQVSEAETGILSGISDFLGDVADTVTNTVGDIAEAASDIAAEAMEQIDDFVDSLTEDGRKKLELQALGFSEEEQDRIVAALATDPNAMRDAKAKLVDDMDITPDQKTALKSIAGGNPRTFKAMCDLATTDPASFAAATATMAALDADGPLDVTPAGVQATRDARIAARAAEGPAQEAITTAQIAIDALQSGPALGSSWETAQQASADAEKAWAEFNAALPDPKDMTEAERQEAMLRGMELDRQRKDAAQAVIDAEAADKAAAAASLTEAQAALAKAKDDQTAALETLKAQDAKRGMLDALTFGRLSPDAHPQIAPEDKAKFLEVFAKDGQIGRNALDLAAHSPDPSVIAQNAGFVADKMLDGFAAPSGDKLDLPEADMRNMATNALRMGASEGQSYFDGFSTYLASGKQLQPDPHGGLTTPLSDPAAERQRKNAIALSRTQAMSAAVINDKGAVNFGSDTAEAAMDHMMFHPGSLTHFTPQMTDKMNEVKTLFTSDATKVEAQGVIDGTALPAVGAPGRTNALKLVAGTTGKDAGAVTDADAKASVLAAMMTPLSQGPVGSCFSTAPVRGIRETDPIRAMTQFSELANTGMYTTPNGQTYPANVNPPKGENPLMRSWEYSVATAAAELTTSREHKKLTGALSKPETFAGMKDVIPDEKWNSSRDPDTGLVIPGVSAKLRKAITQQLKFEYSAGPEVGAVGGSGDGSSTEGGYQVTYKGKALANEADFVAAMKDIALTATGYSATSDEGKAVIAVIEDPKFANTILDSYGAPDPKKIRKDRVAPWNMSSGGFEDQTERVLQGGEPSIDNMLGTTGLLTSRSGRTKDVVGSILGLGSTKPTDMKLISTRGDNANHAFNALPGHPSQDKIRDPNSDAKIEKELVQPGRALASTKLPADQAARLYDDQLRALLPSVSADMRDLIAEAFKRRPTEPMTPKNLKAKVQTELAAYKAVEAQRRADDWVAKNRPDADAAMKQRVLDHFTKAVDSDTSADIQASLMDALPVPEVVIADTNWGGPEGQIYFVAAPDPVTGDLVMWQKNVATGRMTLAGKNWEDSNWYEIK
ncbi:hypothetical protein [Pseudophaeobacter sp.]|uniref:hypothetical protein n=1 Tax=Pseudophaeobacter sp. TaxID=1971739 RepID=UPI003298777D